MVDIENNLPNGIGRAFSIDEDFIIEAIFENGEIHDPFRAIKNNN